MTSILPSPRLPEEDYDGKFYSDRRYGEKRGRLEELMGSDEFRDWMSCEESRLLVLRARDHTDYRWLSAAIRGLVVEKTVDESFYTDSSVIYHDMVGKNEQGPVVSQLIPYVLSWDIDHFCRHKEAVNEALEIFVNPDVAQGDKWSKLWDVAKVILNGWSECHPLEATYIVLGRVEQNLGASSPPPDYLCSEELQDLIFYLARMIQDTRGIKVWLLIWDSSSSKPLKELPGRHNSIINDIGDQFKDITCGINWAASKP